MAVCNLEFAGLLVDGIRSGLLAIDADGKVAALNDGAQRILGLPERSPRADLGRPCCEVLGRQPALARLLLEAAEGREHPSRAELVLESTSGEASRTIGFTLVPLGETGHRGAALFFRDLTPFERMDEQARLRDRFAALGQMAAGLAHEIRNPLASLEVITGLLRRSLTDRPEALGLLADIRGELHRMAGTVTDCLEFVRPVSPEPCWVDLKALVEESLELGLSRVVYEGGIERRFEAGLPRLFVDRDQLRCVVADLIVNALEAMAEHPRAHHRLELGLWTEATDARERVVRLHEAGRDESPRPPRQEVVVEVSDTGPGIPREQRERIFHPFFTTKKHGSGIGLASAQKRLASLDGSLELESPGAGGACFRVRLPIRDAAAEAPE